MAFDGFAAYRITKGEGSTSSSDCRCNEGNLVDAGLEAGVLWSTRGSQFEDESIEGHLPSGTKRSPLQGTFEDAFPFFQGGICKLPGG